MDKKESGGDKYKIIKMLQNKKFDQNKSTTKLMGKGSTFSILLLYLLYLTFYTI